MDPIFFYTFGGLTVLATLLMILQKNPIASAVALVMSFFGLAAIYVTLDAHFVATLQILVYAGAIMVLFIFVIMLLNLKKEEMGQDNFSISKVIVLLLGLAFFSLLGCQFLKLPKNLQFAQISDSFGGAGEIGKLLFSEYIIPFEVIGLLLLVGVIGAILLAQRPSKDVS